MKAQAIVTDSRERQERRGGHLAAALPLAAALAAAALLYAPHGLFAGRHLFGSDFLQCHQYRMEFVRELWQSGYSGLPGWYSREGFGTPFWADIQNFPWIPTHLFLLAFPPHAAYAPGVIVAACLAVLFTYLFARAIGLGRLASATAGFTFAASGYFASRVMAGHLPHLEAYPGIPLLLWLTERLAAARTLRHPAIVLGVAVACVCLAGVPQLPFYAVVTCAAYVLWRCRGERRRAAFAALALGAAATLFVWWPTLQLILRSARALPLDRPDNDVSFPYSRLLALFSPWRDGWPAAVLRQPSVPFHGYPSDATFWETTSYVGLLPWLAVLALAVRLVVRKRRPSAPALFLIAASASGVLLSLPEVQELFRLLPGTVFRSSARLWCLPVLGLALAAGAGLEALTTPARMSRVRWVAGLALVAAHATDLWIHATPFVRSTIAERERRPRIEAVLRRDAGTFRVALDYNLPIAPTRRYDDIGFFSSIQLATSYRALTALRNLPPRYHFQYLSAAREMPAYAIANAGARFVGSVTFRPELRWLLTEGGVHLFEVPHPTPRASFFPTQEVRYWSAAEIHDFLRKPDSSLETQLHLPLEEAHRERRDADAVGSGSSESTGGDGPDAQPPLAAATPYPVTWSRPSPDVMEVQVEANSAGILRVLEAHDPGWSATVDGEPSRVLCSDGFLLAVAVPPGRHMVRFRFATPGARAGLAATSAALLAAVGLLVATRRATGSSPIQPPGRTPAAGGRTP